MKLCVTMLKNKTYDVYSYKGPNDKRFFVLLKLLGDDFTRGTLIDWLSDEKKTTEGNDFVEIRKERGVIALYDISEQFGVERGLLIDLDPLKRFEMSIKNFAEIIFKWDAVRVDRPEIMLVVIHEDNHVSLETDLEVIKQYQDAGYAFKIDEQK